MSETRPAAATTDLGVVDPMRVPGAATARRLWSGLPRVAQVSIVLAVLDIVARALGVFGEQLFLDLGAPLTVVSQFLPHDALILLPAIVLWRQPDALTSTPLVLQGAVAVGLAEALNLPLRSLVSGNAADPIGGPTFVAIALALVRAGGWVAIARGLRWFSPAKPDETAAGLANLVAGGFVLGTVFLTINALFQPNIEFGDALWNDFVRLNNAVVALTGLALAYLAWIAVRGSGDPTRPAASTWLATVALGGLAVGTVLEPFAGPGMLWTVIYWLTHQVAMTALVVAFGLGLADPSGTIEPAVQTHQPVSA